MTHKEKTRDELKLEIASLKRKLDEHIALESRYKFENSILRTSEEKFSKVFQSSPDWIVISTLESGRFVNVNKAFLNITGYSEEEVIGHTALDLDIWVDPREREQMVTSLKNTGKVRDHEVKFRMKSGEVRTMLRSAEAIELDNEQCIISVTHDITARKNAETKLEVFAEELKKQNLELEQFAYVVSHDLQSPLVTIGGYLRLIKKRYGSLLEEKGNEILATTIKTTDRMQLLIKSLLSYACIDGKKNTFEPIETQLILSQTLENLQGLIDTSGAQIRHNDLPRLAVDPIQFSQVLQNLLGNAIKFSNSQDSSPTIELRAKKDHDVWLFSVHDNGIGIPENEYQRIFDVFQHSAERNSGGSGIGLAVCKKIIENHGGTIWVESTLGKGSTFYFTIPETL